MKIAIAGGDKETLSQLVDFVQKYSAETGENVQIVQFSDGIDVVSDYTADFDIIILDTVMKHMEWFKAAELIRSMDKKVVLAFVTDTPSDAIYGYTVEATSFMQKPLSYTFFAQEFARCIKKLESIQKKYIMFSTENGLDRIELNKIVYIESDGHKMIINTTEKTYCVYDTMRSLESKLPKQQFVRCNYCYIVNLFHVKGVHGEYAVLDSNELKISRSRRKAFLETVSKFN